MHRFIRLSVFLLSMLVFTCACTPADSPAEQSAAVSATTTNTAEPSATPEPAAVSPFDMPEPGALALGLPAPITSGNPHQGANALTDGVAEGLMRLHDNTYQPGVAQSYETEDYTRWTFTLRSDAKWSDGTPLTAEDFVYSWTLDSAPISIGLTAEADGANTLIVTLEEPCPWFLQYAASAAFAPIHRTLYEADPAAYGSTPEATGCNGPFLVESMDASVAVLIKNPSYWDAASIHAQKVYLRVAKDEAELIAGVESGSLHAARLYDTVPEGKAHFYPSATTGLLLINRLHTGQDGEMVNEEVSGILSNANFRMALSYAIDRASFEAETGGRYGAAQFYASGALNTNNSGTQTFKSLRDSQISAIRMNATADAEKAKDYLTQFLTRLRYADVGALPEFPLTALDDPNMRAIAELMAAQIKDHLGVTLAIEYVSIDELKSRAAAGDYDMMLFPVTAAYNDPLSVLDLFDEAYAYQGSWSATDVNSYAYYASTLEDSRFEADADVRALQLLQAEGYALSNAPALPLFEERNILILSDENLAISLTWDGSYDYSFTIMGK